MRPSRVATAVLTLSVLLIGAPPAAAKKSAKARTTIAVAPFSTASSEEYWFIGYALADTIESRLARENTFNTLTLKQWNAVLRDRDLPPGAIGSDADKLRVGKLLGARYLVTGSYQARWPEVTVLMRVFDTMSGKVAFSAEGRGKLERLMEVEGQLSVALFKELGVKLPRAPVRTKDVYAFRAAMLCKEIAEMQSLGPRAAPNLPAASVTKAKRDCEHALELEPNYPDALSALGILQAVSGETAEAEKTLRRARKVARRTGLADLGLFWLRFRSGHRDEAIAALGQAVARRPGFLHARGVLGQAYNEVGKHEEARKVWEGYLAISPDHPFALAQLGYTMARLGDIDGAIAKTTEAIARVPDDATLYIERASREIDGKKWQQAESSLRKAMELNPKLAVAYLRLGYVYLETKQDNLARAILKKALAEAEMESERRLRGIACFDLAKVEARGGNKDQALAYLDQAINEGFADTKRFDADPDLAALRSDARYKKMMKRARAGGGDKGAKKNK